MIKFAVIYLLFGLFAQADVGMGQCNDSLESVVQLTVCMDDDIRDLEHLRVRVQNIVYSRIDIKYGKKDAARAKFLKGKLDVSISVWDQYRASYCELESISIAEEDDQAGFVKQCVMSLTKTRIEELRILQISI